MTIRTDGPSDTTLRATVMSRIERPKDIPPYIGPWAVYPNSAFTGKYFYRYQNGADRPVKPKLPKNPSTRTPMTEQDRFKYRTGLKGSKSYYNDSFRPPSNALPKREPRRAYADEPHNYSTSMRAYMAPACGWRRYNGYREYTVSSGSSVRSSFGPANVPTLWTSNDDIRLLSKLRNEVAGSDFNLAVSLAELPQALQMIGNSAIKIASAFRQASRGNFVGAARTLVGFVDPKSGKPVPLPRALATNWLELQYGWLPLLSDAYGAAQFAAQQLEFPLKARVRVRVKKQPVVSSSAPSVITYDGDAKEYGQLIAYLTEKDVAKMIGLQDPLSVAWEKLPYSFVADWFIPIGNFLQARAMASALTGTFVTTKFKSWRVRNVYFTSSPLDSSGYPRIGALQGNVSYAESGYDMTRTVSTSLAVPLPTFKPLAKVASVGHCLNAIALLTQVFAPKHISSFGLNMGPIGSAPHP